MIEKLLTSAFGTLSHHATKVVTSRNSLYGSWRLLNVRITWPVTHKFLSVSAKWYQSKNASDGVINKPVEDEIKQTTGKTYVFQNLLEKNETDPNSQNTPQTDSFAPSLRRITLTAENVYKNIQSKLLIESKPKPSLLESNIQGKKWIIKDIPAAYNIDLMYKSVRSRCNAKLFENIKYVYAKRIQNIDILLNKSKENTGLAQTRCSHSTSHNAIPTVISTAKFHTCSRAYKKKKEETETHFKVNERKPGNLKVAKSVPSTVKKTPTIDKSKNQSKVGIQTLTKSSMGKHCQQKLIHNIHREDECSGERAMLKKTEEVFDLQNVKRGKPFLIKSEVHTIRDVGVDDLQGTAKITKKNSHNMSTHTAPKTFTRAGKLDPGSLEYTWVEMLLPKILDHVRYLNESSLNDNQAELISKTLSVNSLDFVKKDPRTKFSGFPSQTENSRMDDNTTGSSKDVKSE